MQEIQLKNYSDLTKMFFTKVGECRNYTIAFNSCKSLTSHELIERLRNDIAEQVNSTIKACTDIYNRTRNEGKDTEGLLLKWKQTMPIDVYERLLSKLDIQRPVEKARPQTADFEQLSKYIDAGFQLYPCSYENGTPHAICKIYQKDGKTVITENRIGTKEALKEFMNGNGFCHTDDGKKWANKKNIELFAIYPNQWHLFCLDIDGKNKIDGTKHGTGANGIEEFLNIIKKTDLTDRQKSMFENFPMNFPCYVSTPSGGIHLYFRCYNIPAGWHIEGNVTDGETVTNVECKHNKQITVAGSVKLGKQYVLHGDLDNIPLIPMDLLNRCCRARPILQPKQKVYYKKEYQNRNSDDFITPQFCIEKGKEHCNGCGHNNMFASVVSTFHHFYEKTQTSELDKAGCKSWIMQDYDYLTWQDRDKEYQIDQTLKHYYGG